MIRTAALNVPEHVEEIKLDSIFINDQFFVLGFSNGKDIRKPISQEQLEAIVKLLDVDGFSENGIKVNKEKKE